MTDTAFWSPATARAQLWRVALGAVVIVAVWFAAGFGLVWLAGRISGLPPEMVMDITRWEGAALFFLSFLGLHLGLALALPLLHRRGYASLFGPTQSVNRAHFRIGVLVMFALAGGLQALVLVERVVLPEAIAPEVTRLRPIGAWLLGLVPALGLILMQVAAEELAFRGYLLQQLRAQFRSPLIWAVLPSLAFGALHFDPVKYGVLNASAYVVNATLMGTFAAFVTVRTGNLGAAIGLHFGNNAAVTLVGLEGDLSGFSLFGIDLDPSSGYATYSIVVQTLAATLLFLAWLRWMTRHRPIANHPGAA